MRTEKQTRTKLVYAHRRNVATGQKAMAVAEQLALEGKRKNGRWERGSITQTSGLSGDAWTEAMCLAGLVLDYAPELADQVIAWMCLGRVEAHGAARYGDGQYESAARGQLRLRAGFA